MKKTLKKLLIILLYIGLILISTKAYAASTGTTINDTTRIREKANTDYKTVALLTGNTEVKILSKEDGWYKVSYKSYTGYIREDLLKVTESKEETTNKTTSENVVADTNTTSTENVSANTTSNVTTTNTTTNNETEQKSEVDTTQAEETNKEALQKGYQGTLPTSIGIRLLPTINSSVIVTLPENTSFTILDVMNKWCYIETENNSGWVFLSKIVDTAKKATQVSEEVSTEKEEEKPAEQEKNPEETKQEETKQEEAKKEETKTVTKYVSTETLNVREKPDNNAKIVSQITLNTQVTIVEEVDSTWSKIKVKSTTGYVASKFLSDKKTENTSRSENQSRTSSETETASESTESSKNVEETKTAENKASTSASKSAGSKTSGVTGADIVAYAKQYLGYKYVSGGSSPSTGFDCSGFTSYVYKHFGYTLNRVSKDQINNGTAVEKSNLKEGDIVLFKGSSGSAIRACWNIYWW